MSIFFRRLFGTAEAMDPAMIKAKKLIEENPVVLFSKTWCSYCTSAKRVLNGRLGEGNYATFELDREPDGPQIQRALMQLSGQRTVPNIFIGAKHVGGYDDLTALDRSNALQARVAKAREAFAAAPATAVTAEGGNEGAKEADSGANDADSGAKVAD